MYNLLSSRIFKVRLSDGGPDKLSLPSLMSALVADRISSFDALRAHQAHSLHAFLSQLATLSMCAAGTTSMPQSATSWRQILASLTGGRGEGPWHLVIGRADMPAFMQPPVTDEVEQSHYKRIAGTPGAIDMLVGSLNHEVKAETGWNAELDDWVYALINVQTMGDYAGRGYYPVARMNSGYGYRNALSLMPPGRIGAKIVRDATAMLASWDEVLERYPFSDDGLALMWLEPWSGGKEEAIPLAELCPYHIEVCRRLRLATDDSGTIHALKASSAGRRVDAGDMAGIVGDPWLPVNVERKLALTLGETGFSYRRLVEYLTHENWELPLLLRPTPAECDREMELVARGMRRGQGKTEGYYERHVPITSGTARALGDESARKRLGEIAQERIEEISAVVAIMGHALAVYAQGDGEREAMRSRQRLLTRTLERHLDTAVEAGFFASLQEEFAAGPGSAERVRIAWLRSEVVGRARGLLSDAMDSMSVRLTDRYRRRAQATSLFEGRIRSENSPIRYAYHTEEGGTNDARGTVDERE